MEATKAREVLDLDNNAPLVKIAIPHMDGCSLLYYIAPIPRVTPYTPLGRTTHGFPAYNVLRGKPIYLKDSWRVNIGQRGVFTKSRKLLIVFKSLVQSGFFA